MLVSWIRRGHQYVWLIRRKSHVLLRAKPNDEILFLVQFLKLQFIYNINSVRDNFI